MIHLSLLCMHIPVIEVADSLLSYSLGFLPLVRICILPL